MDHGAMGDNTTTNTLAIQQTIDSCHDLCEHWLVIHHDAKETTEQPVTVVVHVPPGDFKTGSILLKSNMQLHLARGAGLYGSPHTYDYPIVPTLPNGYVTGKGAMWRALIAGYHVENVSVTGENQGAPDAASVVDGVGWKWWCWRDSFPIPQGYCRRFNPTNATIPKEMMRPKLIEFYDSRNILLQRFTAQNSPNWHIHPFVCDNVVMKNLTVLAPREVGNTDGIDPDSTQNVLMDSCYIDVGDDGVSLKSTNVSGTMWPTRNVHMTNLTIMSRNWCIGSATFGGIYDILFEDSRIGSSDEVTSPWAIKFKSHRYYPGPMENITIRRITIGKIGPTPWMYPDRTGIALIVGLTYQSDNPDHPPEHRSGSPLLRNVTFEDITIASAGQAGEFHGLPEDCMEGLTLRNITVLDQNTTWYCDNADSKSLTVEDVSPPITCADKCNSTVRQRLDEELLPIDFL
jgi:polygalacturonase